MNNHAIAIIISDFNTAITEKLLEGAMSRLKSKGKTDQDIHVIHVPGAVEIPLVAKALAIGQKYAAIIALGAVVRGETSHYDYVCNQVSEGCQQVMLEYMIPVIFGVLTTENEEQAYDRLGGNHGHKGEDSADAALAMIQIMSDLTL